MHAKISQRSILEFILFFTVDISIKPDIEIYADDTIIFSIYKNIENATRKLQNHLKKIENWL